MSEESTMTLEDAAKLMSRLHNHILETKGKGHFAGVLRELLPTYTHGDSYEADAEQFLENPKALAKLLLLIG